MTIWNTCSAVERDLNKVSGTWVFCGMVPNAEALKDPLEIESNFVLLWIV